MNQKLKYYCRGLGTGILVTTLLLIARPSSGQESLTNEEIIARAEALGMMRIESLTDLPQPSKEDTASSEEETVPSQKETATETAETVATTQETETAATEAETSEAGTETFETKPSTAETSNSKTESSSSDTNSSTNDAASDSQTATITISRGNGSLTVSRALEAAGLIDDAKDYDQYLCDEGYDNALRVGVYHIPLGSTYEQIAKIITGKSV
jgi:hypothetical protein